MNSTIAGSSGAELAMFADELHTVFVARCLAAAALALTLYEYLLTLSNEVALFWYTKPSSASVILFFPVRLILLAIAATSIAGNFVPGATATVIACESYNVWDATLTMLGYGIIAVTSATRVFAVTGRSWVLALPTLGLGLAPIFINIYLLTTAHYQVKSGPTTPVCAVLSVLSADSANKGTYSNLALASRLCVILSDILVVSTTWFNLFHPAQMSVKSGIFTRSISYYLLRDGTLHFSMILILNLIDIILWWFERIQFFTTLIFPLTLILLSRLLMSLRQAAYTDGALGSFNITSYSAGEDSFTQMSDVVFVPRSIPDTETASSPVIETIKDDEGFESPDVVIVDGDVDEAVVVGQLEAIMLK